MPCNVLNAQAMADQIGNITVPEIAASGTFPIVADYPFGPFQSSGRGDPPVLEHRRHHGDTAQRARLPGEIPPISVTSAATARAANTAAGKRDCGGSLGPLTYITPA